MVYIPIVAPGLIYGYIEYATKYSVMWGSDSTGLGQIRRISTASLSVSILFFVNLVNVKQT
jgi:hypothetical protein